VTCSKHGIIGVQWSATLTNFFNRPKLNCFLKKNDSIKGRCTGTWWAHWCRRERHVTSPLTSAGPFRPGPHGPVYPCSTLAGGKRSARQDEIEVQWKPGRPFQINGLSSRRKLLIKCRNQMRHRRAIRPISLKSSLQIVEISSFSFLFTRPD